MHHIRTYLSMYVLYIQHLYTYIHTMLRDCTHVLTKISECAHNGPFWQSMQHRVNKYWYEKRVVWLGNILWISSMEFSSHRKYWYVYTYACMYARTHVHRAKHIRTHNYAHTHDRAILFVGIVKWYLSHYWIQLCLHNSISSSKEIQWHMQSPISY